MTLKYRGSNQPRFDLSSRTSQERSIEKEEETISKFLDKAYEFNSWNFFSLDSFTECFSLWKKTHEIFSINTLLKLKIRVARKPIRRKHVTDSKISQ